MEELTIQQKAKAYDEVREKIALRFGSNVAEEIFSEFEESEDERIKKAIIEHFTGSHSSMYPYKGFTKKQVLAWLEKQGEQNPADKVEPKFKVGDKVYALRNRFECAIESMDETTYYGDTTNFDIKDQDNWKLVEQKSAWSEEDENRFRNLIYLVEHSNEGKGTKEGFVKFINRLKSLRPQNTWEPSKEQLEALEHFVRSLGESGYASPYENNTKLLYSLLEQLKKLKG